MAIVGSFLLFVSVLASLTSAFVTLLILNAYLKERVEDLLYGALSIFFLFLSSLFYIPFYIGASAEILYIFSKLIAITASLVILLAYIYFMRVSGFEKFTLLNFIIFTLFGGIIVSALYSNFKVKSVGSYYILERSSAFPFLYLFDAFTIIIFTSIIYILHKLDSSLTTSSKKKLIRMMIGTMILGFSGVLVGIMIPFNELGGIENIAIFLGAVLLFYLLAKNPHLPYVLSNPLKRVVLLTKIGDVLYDRALTPKAAEEPAFFAVIVSILEKVRELGDIEDKFVSLEHENCLTMYVKSELIGVLIQDKCTLLPRIHIKKAVETISSQYSEKIKKFDFSPEDKEKIKEIIEREFRDLYP